MILCILLLNYIQKVWTITYITHFERCSENNVIIDMTNFEALHIEGSIRNENERKSFCIYNIYQSQHSLIRLLGSRINRFETVSTSGSLAFITFKNNRNISLFEIASNFQYDTEILMRFMLEKKISSTENFKLHFSIPPRSTVSLTIHFVNIYYCRDHKIGEFDCEDSLNSSRICIAASLKCDGIVNCFDSNADESLICLKNPTFDFGVPLIILIGCLLLVILWVTFRMFSCVCHVEREENYPITSRIIPIYEFVPQQPPSHLSIVETPDITLIAPPQYLVSTTLQPTLNALPPSYSENVLPGIYPDFFKRFFGKHSQENISSKRTKSDCSTERLRHAPRFFGVPP